MYYGQWETDRHATEYFNFAGIAVEVGAALPHTGSNTYHFEQYGWKVLCIEANPRLISFLRSLRKNVVNVAVGAKNEDGVDFHIVKLPNGDQTAISGLKLDKKLLATHTVDTIEIVKVNVRTLDTLLEDWGVDHVDYVSIDTEGTELDVLKGFNLDKYKPRLVIVENNHNDYKLREYMSKRGYRLDKQVVVNDFFVRE